jgi:hypothetical protein
MYVRARPLVTVVFVDSTGRDPDLRAFVDKIESERAIGTAGMAHRVVAPLRPPSRLDRGGGAGRPVDTHRAGAGRPPPPPARVDADRYEQWLAETMADALLGPP